MGLTWAAGWAPIGVFTGWGVALALGFPLGTVGTNFALLFAVLGFVGGMLFSTVLRVAERGRRVDELSPRRFVGWGALGGLLLGALAVALEVLGSGPSLLGAVIVAAATALGAGSAAATLAIARAAPPGPRSTRGEDDEDGDAAGAPGLLAPGAARAHDLRGARRERAGAERGA